MSHSAGDLGRFLGPTFLLDLLPVAHYGRALIYMAIRLPRTVSRKTVAATALLCAISVVPTIFFDQSIAQDKAYALKGSEPAKFREAAWAHFQKRCKEKAGEKIYRTVGGVKGFFLAKPRVPPTEDQLRDQFWMGDPYGLQLYPPAEISGYLRALDDNDIPTMKSTPRHGFLFVETPHRDSGVVRHRLDEATKKITAEISKSRHSRFAVSWEDISTSEDRMYWVAGGLLRVTELSSNEVLGERIGYVFETEFGSADGGRRPWLIAQRNACPPLRRNAAMDRLFVEKVLNPLKGESYAK